MSAGRSKQDWEATSYSLAESSLVLQQLVAEADLLKRPANLQVALRIGALVQQCLKAGQGYPPGQGAQTYRQLAHAANLGRSASALCRCVKVHELAQDLPEIASFVHLSTTHVRAVVNLPLSQQRSLLAQAEAERWTCIRLEKAAAELRRTPKALQEATERGRISGFFGTPGADISRSLSCSLSHLKRAQQRAAGGFPEHVKQNIDSKLRTLQANLTELARTFEPDPKDEPAPISPGPNSKTPGE